VVHSGFVNTGLGKIVNDVLVNERYETRPNVSLPQHTQESSSMVTLETKNWPSSRMHSEQVV
jgi:hypothetical protein